MFMEIMNLALKKIILEEITKYLSELDALSATEKENNTKNVSNYVKEVTKIVDDFLRVVNSKQNSTLSLIDDINSKKLMSKSFLDLKNSAVNFKALLLQLAPKEEETTI